VHPRTWQVKISSMCYMVTSMIAFALIRLGLPGGSLRHRVALSALSAVACVNEQLFLLTTTKL